MKGLDPIQKQIMITVAIVVVILMIIVLTILYILNHKIKYRRAIDNKESEESRLFRLTKIKQEIYKDIKSIIESGISYVKDYDQWNHDVKISDYRNDINNKIKNITNSFDYKAMETNTDESELFKITSKLTKVNPLYWERNLELDIKKFYLKGKEYGWN